MSGAQLVEEACKIRGDLTVIVASGYSTESDPRDRGALQDVAFLPKPFNLSQLRRALENA
jgi:DNA-binding NtrC family response regulator